MRLLGSALLPAEIRAGYGLKWRAQHRAAFWLASRFLRLLRFLLPHILGRSVVIDFAQRRVRGELQPAVSLAPGSTAGE